LLRRAEEMVRKAAVSEAGLQAVDHAVQTFGGAGYCRGVIERLCRDVGVSRIYESSSEIQRNQIANSLLNRSLAAHR
jgi:acyl-CoA dehydrogenase